MYPEDDESSEATIINIDNAIAMPVKIQDVRSSDLIKLCFSWGVFVDG